MRWWIWPSSGSLLTPGLLLSAAWVRRLGRGKDGSERAFILASRWFWVSIPPANSHIRAFFSFSKLCGFEDTVPARPYAPVERIVEPSPCKPWPPRALSAALCRAGGPEPDHELNSWRSS